jgi:hypothetical protein
MPDQKAFTATRRLYDLLGASPDATPKAIRSCYRKAVKKCHPDLFPRGSAEQSHAAAKFRELTAAYRRIKHAPLRYVSKSASRGSSASEETRREGTIPVPAEPASDAALSSMAATPGMGRNLLWAHFFLVIVNIVIPLWGLHVAGPHAKKMWGVFSFSLVVLAVHATELWDELQGRHAFEDNSPLRSVFAEVSGMTFGVYPLLIALFLILALLSVGYLAIGPALALVTWLLVTYHLRTRHS